MTMPNLHPKAVEMIQEQRQKEVGHIREKDGELVLIVDYDKRADAFVCCPARQNWMDSDTCQCRDDQYHFLVAVEDFGPEGDSRSPLNVFHDGLADEEIDDQSEKCTSADPNCACQVHEAGREIEATRRNLSPAELQRALLKHLPGSVPPSASAMRSARRADARRNA